MMELDCDLNQINNEELLRKMWQQSEDVNRKKEIRSHLHKLRETRLRDLYTGGDDPFIMSGNSGSGFSKDPLLHSHGDSLIDQSFQSMKAKEVRDSASPTHDIKFHSLALSQPTNTGWDVRSSSEVTPDGRAFRSETVATTDGTEKINGGVAEFKGLNEQRSSASHQGDDKNFIKKASDSSKTHLQEKVVIGDENSARTEMKTSSTTTSSSSQVFSSSSTTQHDDVGAPFGQPQQKYLTDVSNRQYDQQQQQHHHHHQQHHHQQHQQRLQEENYHQQQQLRQQHEEERRMSSSQEQTTKQEQHSETYNQSRQNTSQNVETQSHHEQNKRYVDMDKASPEYQRQVQHLMSQPGEILSNTVEYPKPNVKMITTVKRLPDGTIVKNKRYETEDLTPSKEHIEHHSSTSTSATNQKSTQRHVEEENLQSRLKNSRDRTTTNTRQLSPQRPNVDAVDNAQNIRYTPDRQQQFVETHPQYKEDIINKTSSSTFSNVKKSSRRFSTETTSETIEEVDERTPVRGKPQDFSTHGFPSVRPNKPTQEYANERPRTAEPSQDFKPHKPTQQYPTGRPSPVRSVDVTQREVTDSSSPNVRTIKTPDGDVVVVSKETQHSVKQKSNSERIVETEVISDIGAGPQRHVPQQIIHHTTHQHKTEDFSTHGFPSVKENVNVLDDMPRHGTPTRDHVTPTRDHVTITHEHQRQAHHTEDFTTHGFPSVKETSPCWDDMPRHGTSTRDHVAPTHEQPRQPHHKEDFTTHGFPSVKENSPVWDDMPRHGTPTRDHVSPNKTVQPYVTNEDQHTVVSSETRRTTSHKTNAERIIEVVTDAGHPNYVRPEDDFSTHGFPSVRDVKKTRDISPVHITPVRDRPISPRRHDDYTTHGFPSARSPTRSKPDYSTHGFPSARSPTRTKPDYSTTKGFPSTKDAKPKQRTTQSPTRKVVTTTTTSSVKRPTPKSTTTTTTTDGRTSLRKQHDVDASHRRFAASLRSSSPVDNHRHDSHDSHHHQKLTPRSSISSQATTRTFRRDQRESSHDSAAPSETSRISSSTVTRQSPGKNVGKTLVTSKQTVVKTRNLNGSNDTNDLKPQRTTTTTIKTKSPSPGKSVTTTTTTTTTSSIQRGPKTPTTPTKSFPTTPTKSTPTSPTKLTPTTPTKSTPTSPTKSAPISKPIPQEAPKTDNQLTKPTADEQILINHEPLTITKTAFSSNDASFPQNEAIIEEPICRKKHFYQLGPSDDTTTNTTTTTTITTNTTSPKDAKSPSTYSPTAPNSHSKPYRTSPKEQQQQHDQHQHHNVIKKDSPEREYAPIRYTSESENEPLPSTVFEPNKRSPYKTTKPDDNESRKTVLRETTFEKTEQQKLVPEQVTSLDEPQYDSDEPSVTSDFEPYHRNDDETFNKKPTNNQTSVNENERVEALFNVNVNTKKVTKDVKENINEKFINIERDENLLKNIDESLDGAFFSKQPTDVQPTTPTFKKKGLTRGETFEERCRQILGMEDSGDTQGNFKTLPDEPEKVEEPNVKTSKPTDKPDIEFLVKIEDCDDDEDDKPMSINTIRENLNNKKTATVKTEKSSTKTKPTPRVIDNVFESETVTIESKENITKATTKSKPERESPKRESSTTPRRSSKDIKPNERHTPSPSPSKYSPERPKSPETYTGPIHRKGTSSSPKRQQLPHTPNIDVQFEVMPKSKSPSPTRKNKSPSPTRASPYINEQTTIEVVTGTTKRQTKYKSPSPSPKRKPTKSTSIVESEIETESYPESEVDSVKDNFVTEKIIECSNKTKNQPPKSPKSKGPTITESVTMTTTTTKHKTAPSKATPKSPQKTQVDSNYEIETKTNRSTNATVKTTAKHTISPKQDSTTPKSRPGSTAKVVETVKETVTTRKPKSVETPEPTIKNRLRSATRRSPNKSKPDERDGSLSSSPEPSPTRATERRRSSNISVHTEIIIEHAGSKSPERETPTMKRKTQQPTSPKKTTSKDAPDTLLNRKLPVTERKESAPVNRVTRREDDIKMSRSTSENIIKVNGQKKPTNKKPAEPVALSPKREPRPNKCFTTKTINLTTNDRLIDSSDIENVIIDIQHAKSSREPSPDKIVPTPVPAEMDTGKPRYPDVVQEPEDEPRRKPVVKNIPILEEDTNAYINCHISEVKVEKTVKSKNSIIDHTDYNDEILTEPMIEAPISLDYPSIDKPDDECLLSVHEKVSKFINTAEETSKSKPSSPFNPNYEKSPQMPDDDDCLLTVDQKVSKFLKTAESITKTPITQPRDIERPNLEDLDDEIRNDECTLSVSEKVNKFINTAEKLAPSTPQKSPELVARMERQISRQSEPGELGGEECEPVLEPFSENHTVALELKRQKDILTRPSAWDKNGPREPAEYVPNPENDDDELVPMTKTHTTDIELRRQKDILSRPSVFQGSKTTPTKPQSPAPTKKSTILDRMQRFESNQKHTTSHEVETEKVTTKSLIDNRNSSTNSTTVNTTRSRFETPKSGPGKEPVTTASKSQKLNVNGKAPTSDTKPSQSNRPVENGKPKSPSFKKAKPLDERPSTDETESEIEFIETEQSISRKSSTQSTRKIETNQAQPKSPREVSHSPTRRPNSSSRSSSPKKSTNSYSTVTTSSVNQRTTKPHSVSPSKTTEFELHESIIETSPRDSTTPVQQTTPLTRKPKVITESVAARRNIFEKTATTTKPTTPIDDRRPSYMDHTRSSIEHIRRDSLEVNKTHYARKPSTDDDNQLPARPNTTVKFDVPQKTLKHESISEDINIEEIFDLEILEEMLESVTSYELRRRIRAQIRLVKKNALNTTHTDSKTLSSNKTSMHKSSMYTSSSSSKSHHHQHHRHEESEIMHHDDTHAQKPSSSNRSRSPQSYDKTCKKPFDRSPSPTEKKTVTTTTTKEMHRSSGPDSLRSKHYKHTEQVDYANKHERTHDRQVIHEVHHSPERSSMSPERQHSPSSKPPVKPRERSPSSDFSKSKHSPERGSPVPKPRERSHSPAQKSTGTCEEKRTSITKTSVRKTYSPERKSSKPRSDEKTPIWADRKNILKTPSSQSPVPSRKAPSSPTTRTSATKTTKSTVVQRQSKTNEDSITSSYGIGPTDENGLPIFGIKALKKKSSKPAVDPCEATEEVTGYVIEEQWYSDGTKVPKHERKEFIYSTNDEDLKSMKKHVESRNYTKDDVNVTRKYQKIDKEQLHKEPQAIMSGDVEDFTTSNKKYVRRGSVKEMSEKFIRKESSQSISDKSTTKSSAYPKAGLILRTNSRKGSMGADDDIDDDSGVMSTMTTTSTTTRTTSKKQPSSTATRKTSTNMEHDNYDSFESAHAHENYEHEHEEQQSTTRSFHESESECESMSKKREFVSKKSSSSMAQSSSTRSFLNSTGESRVVTDVDDVLERMRNADNVVEDGDTAEDQEARALLNKFLGASVIMRGVETGNLTSSPKTKHETKTTTSNTSYNDGDKVTTTRVTKTIKSSGSSSTPVTYTTCDIEEIWDEEILKQLLERATTYEERRKIRARLRELMAEREGKNSANIAEKTVTSTQQVEEEESSGSEYEEIIEEVTDYSDTDEEEDVVKNSSETNLKKSSSTQSYESAKSIEKTASEVNVESAKKLENFEETVTDAKSDKTAIDAVKTEAEKEQAGELLLPLLQNLLHKSSTSATKQQTTNKQIAIENSINNTNLSSKPPSKANTNKTAVDSGSEVGDGSNNSSSNSNRVNLSNNSSSNRAEHSQKNENSISSCTEVLSVVSNNKKTDKTVTTVATTTTDKETNKTDITTTNKMWTKNAKNNASNNNDSNTKLDRLNVPQREDSGTESGEDLRLIAAGLRDKLQMQNGDSNLIEEVTTALSRLESSLKEGRDIALDGQKRKALLALVARLQTGLTSPERLDDANASSNLNDFHELNYDEISSPEVDGNRNSRHRFAKRRNRNSRHTVGVSREELADARRYMEDMLMMNSISNCTTPDSSGAPTTTTTPPQCFPLEKNVSSGAILYTQTPTQPLFRPNQFVPNNIKKSMDHLTVEQSPVVLRNNNGKHQRRPLSGEITVKFEEPQKDKDFASDSAADPSNQNGGARFNGKKQIMKRANTIDIPKTKKYNPDFDTDSEAEDKGPHLGLKRAVQVSVKKKVRHVVPIFEPKTENDRKFLAFINKQSPKHGLGWASSKSVSNWTNKFGSIKNTFEVGAAASATTGKPPQVPGHHSSAANRKQQSLDHSAYSQRNNQQHWQLQQQQQQQQEAVERQRLRIERDRIERERIEKDRLERQHFERERMERDRLERERYERERQERDRMEREYFERERQRVERERRVAQEQKHQLLQQQQQQQLLQQQLQQEQLMEQQEMNQPTPVNQFKHAPQSVFKPIESDNLPVHNVYKPIPQNPSKPIPPNTWQPPRSSTNKTSSKSSSIASPQFLIQKYSPYSGSPSSTATSPVGLPWVSNSTGFNKDFKAKAHRFEEASLRDREAELSSYNTQSSHGLHRHNSLNIPKAYQHQFEDLRKRPSLPNAADPYQALHSQYGASYQDLPPPINVSFRYAEYGPPPPMRTSNFKSVPCLPTAVDDAPMAGYPRSRQDSLTNPRAMPLVLTNSNPVYGSNSDSLQNKYALPPTRQFEYARPNVDSAATSPSIATMPHTDYTDDDLDSDNNLLEYRAESKVMRKPQSQMAVTVGRRTAHVSDDELYGRNSRAAKNLLSTMRTFGSSQKPKQSEHPQEKTSITPITSPTPPLSLDGRSYQAPIVEPLFPELTSFKPNRDPLFIKSTENAKSQFKQDTSYRPQQTKTIKAPMKQSLSYDQDYIDQQYQYQPQYQPPKYEPAYIDQAKYYQPPPPQQTSRAPPAAAPVPAPYVSETQASYVVTYPLDDPSDIEDQYQPKSHPNIQLQRQRNFSENSTSSSVSYSYNNSNNLPSPSSSWTANPQRSNAPSPNTSWTPNPVHLDNKQSEQSSAQMTTMHNVSQSSNEQIYFNQSQKQQQREQEKQPMQQQKMAQPQQQYKQDKIQSSKQVTSKTPQKPDLAPKPQTTAAPTTYQELTHEHVQIPLPAKERPPKLNLRSQTIPTPGTESYKTSSTTKTYQQQQKTTMQTIENSTNNSKTVKAPIKSQRVTSQQSLVSKQQQFEQKQHRNQQEQENSEVGRKSLGQIFDEQEQQRKAAYYESHQQTQIIKHEEYKSSAPADTPDIVKSSLPKDDSQPILKKFGPPQRHHYMPNSYQAPTVKTQSSTQSHSEIKKFSASSTSKIIKNEVVQHSLTTNKPSIVEIPATPQPQDANTKDQIPRNIVFNNINAFTSMTQRYHQEQERSTENIRVNRLSKSDSWNQICKAQQAPRPSAGSPKFNTSGNELRRSKSGHSLAVPKMYEAGMNKEEISEKQRTVAAYFSANKSPNTTEATHTEVVMTKKSSINRIKTNEKVSANRKSLTSNATGGNVNGGGLSRSATMPHIGNLNLLDESNTDDAFEQLMLAQQMPEQKGESATSSVEKSETKEKDGAIMTTTTKVTTRTVTGGTAPKVSPFAKFKQLDRQNSQQSQKSPSTPTTPGCSTPTTPGSAPIFKFTDPALNARAATVKDQLLQWCQSKTSEYENVEITNFSSSWSNGLAFCALIHHFLPDAFDYTKLTSKTRRHNFELAFTVADEKAGIAPLLDVEDMVVMQRPDWKCVFVYVQSIYRRFRNCQ